jgi:hypothetical protein
MKVNREADKMDSKPCPTCQEYNLAHARNCVICGALLRGQATTSGQPLSNGERRSMANWET